MAGGDHNSVRILRDCLFKLERLACVFTWAELLSQWLAKQPQLAAFEHGGYPDDDRMCLGTSDATLMGWYYWRISPDILPAGENKHILRIIKAHFTTLQVSVWAPLHYPVARDEDGYTSSSSGFLIDSCTKEEMYSFDKTERYAACHVRRSNLAARVHLVP
ncbi:hypothetical protein BGW80DRAFT_1469197 [Lactifluus volemus]|nr:hypothetical protein BGW80DRAFT_1469197 [Lactifluus volemus]